MSKYIITTHSNQVGIDHVITIDADTDADAQVQAQNIVNEQNSLENGHSTGWFVKSVIAGVEPPPEVNLN
jgi:hypothetical protein